MHLAMRRRRRQHAISFQSRAHKLLLLLVSPAPVLIYCALVAPQAALWLLLLLQLKITLQLLHLLMTTLAPKVVSTALGALTDELLIRKCFSLATLCFPLATVVAVVADAVARKKREQSVFVNN